MLRVDDESAWTDHRTQVKLMQRMLVNPASTFMREVLNSAPIPVRAELKYLFGRCECGNDACNCSFCLRDKDGRRDTCRACAGLVEHHQGIDPHHGRKYPTYIP